MKKSLMPLLGLALACVLVLSGCGSAAEGVVPGEAVSASPAASPNNSDGEAETAVVSWYDAGEGPGDGGAYDGISRDEVLRHYGFQDADAPFFTYYGEDQKLQLELYLRETADVGCGFRYIQTADGEAPEVYAFGFSGLAEQWADPGCMVPFSAEPFGGEDVSEVLAGYQASFTYNEAGKPLEFHSTGMDPEPAVRLAFARCYITHGSLEYYYAYEGDLAQPSYRLVLDESLGYLYPTLTALGQAAPT